MADTIDKIMLRVKIVEDMNAVVQEFWERLHCAVKEFNAHTEWCTEQQHCSASVSSAMLLLYNCACSIATYKVHTNDDKVRAVMETLPHIRRAAELVLSVVPDDLRDEMTYHYEALIAECDAVSAAFTLMAENDTSCKISPI